MIDLTDLNMVRSRKPLMISHRGVTDHNTSENSLHAIHQAATRGYDMVEIDVQETRDRQPIVFHDRTIKEGGEAKKLQDLTLDEATAIRYRRENQSLATLAQAFELCRFLELGVILDIKTRDRSPSDDFIKNISTLLEKYQLLHSCIIFSSHPTIYKYLAVKTFFAVIFSLEHKKWKASEKILPLKKKIWFDFPENVTDQDVKTIHQEEAIIFCTLKESRYPQDTRHLSADRDAKRLLLAGIDGFLIDSAYEGFFKLPK